mmetsp:Transcript_25316/g.37867  ORF Transcript_25316/g.37867 Transcript_25316/m.37867 type:complete len:569 (+) Transcript_25316:331-2037(+)
MDFHIEHKLSVEEMKTSKTFVALLCVLCTLDHRAKADLAIISKLGTSLTTSNKIANIPEQDRTVLTCEDTTERFEVIEPNGKKKMKTCDWVAEEKTNWRCGRPGVSLQCPLTCDACCEDSEEKYRVTIGTFAGKKKTCTWAGEKVRPRCNDPAAQEACPASCGLCPSPGTPAPTVATKAPTGSTPAPSTMGPTPAPTSAAPTQYYNWCVDSEERFALDSVPWINKKKSCAWVRQSNPWWKCTVPEVLDNCPYSCGVCECRNNQGRFKIKNGELKSCSWAAREDTWWRCNNYPAVRRNCPLLCGECDKEFPSTAPSAAPSIEKFPTLKVESTAELGLDDLKIPEDPDELATMKAALVETMLPFLPEGSVVTNAELVYVQARQGGLIGKLILTIVKVIILTSDTPEEAAEVTKGFLEEIDDTLSENLEGGLQSELNVAIQETFDDLGVPFVAVIGEASAEAGIAANVTNVTTIDPTAFPSASPTDPPTLTPSKVPSSKPSQMASPEPSITISAKPSESPTPIPSPSPTSPPSKKPTLKPSPRPSVMPSLEPSVTPTLEPTGTPSSEPTDI